MQDVGQGRRSWPKASTWQPGSSSTRWDQNTKSSTGRQRRARCTAAIGTSCSWLRKNHEMNPFSLSHRPSVRLKPGSIHVIKHTQHLILCLSREATCYLRNVICINFLKSWAVMTDFSNFFPLSPSDVILFDKQYFGLKGTNKEIIWCELVWASDFLPKNAAGINMWKTPSVMGVDGKTWKSLIILITHLSWNNGKRSHSEVKDTGFAQKSKSNQIKM